MAVTKIVSRQFSVALERSAVNEGPKVRSSVLNQHIKYTPSRRIRFDLDTSEGRMALVFQGKENPFSNVPKVSWMATIATMVAVPLGLPEDLVVLIEPSLLLPLGLTYRQLNRQRHDKAYTVRRMYLLENGQQLVLETHDGVLQRLNIL